LYSSKRISEILARNQGDVPSNWSAAGLWKIDREVELKTTILRYGKAQGNFSLIPKIEKERKTN